MYLTVYSILGAITGSFNQNVILGNNIHLRQGKASSSSSSPLAANTALIVPIAADDLLRNGAVSFIVSASSEYPTDSGAYAKEHVFDGKLDTEWSSNLEGEDASITFHFAEQVYATSICVRQRMMHDDQSLMSGVQFDYLDGGFNDTMSLENVEDPVASVAYKNVTTFPNGWSWGVQAEKCFTYTTTPRIFSSIRLSATGMLVPTIPNSGFNEIRILGSKASTLTRPSYVCENAEGSVAYAGHTSFGGNWQLQGTDICASAGTMYRDMHRGSAATTCGATGQGVLSAVSRILGYEKAIRDGEDTSCSIEKSQLFQWTREGLREAQLVEDTHVNATFSDADFAMMVRNLHYIYYTHIDYINEECKSHRGDGYYTTAMWASYDNRDIETEHAPSAAFAAMRHWGDRYVSHTGTSM